MSFKISVNGNILALTARKQDNIDPKLIFGNKLNVKVPTLVQPWNAIFKFKIPLDGKMAVIDKASVTICAYALPISLKVGRNAHRGHHSYADTVDAIIGELEDEWNVEERHSGSSPQYSFLRLSKEGVPINKLAYYIAFQEVFKEKVVNELKENPGNMARHHADAFIGSIASAANEKAEVAGAALSKALKSFDGLKNYLNGLGFSVELLL